MLKLRLSTRTLLVKESLGSLKCNNSVRNAVKTFLWRSEPRSNGKTLPKPITAQRTAPLSQGQNLRNLHLTKVQHRIPPPVLVHTSNHHIWKSSTQQIHCHWSQVCQHVRKVAPEKSTSVFFFVPQMQASKLFTQWGDGRNEHGHVVLTRTSPGHSHYCSGRFRWFTKWTLRRRDARLWHDAGAVVQSLATWNHRQWGRVRRGAFFLTLPFCTVTECYALCNFQHCN